MAETFPANQRVSTADSHPQKSVAGPRDEKSHSLARSRLASGYQIPEGQVDRAAGAMKFGCVPVRCHWPSLARRERYYRPCPRTISIAGF
jgi:hypothetical protein